MRIELGIPAHEPIDCVRLKGLARSLEGWVFEQIGIRLDMVRPGTERVWRVVSYHSPDGRVAWETLANPHLPPDFEQTRGPLVDDLIMQLWSTRVRFRDSAVFSERRWHPNLGTSKWNGGIPDGEQHPTAEESKLARRGFKAMRDLSSISSRGRRRLEKKPGTPELQFAHRARELLRKDPSMKDEDLADRLGMIDYEEGIDDPRVQGKAIRSAAKKIRYYLDRLAEVETGQ